MASHVRVPLDSLRPSRNPRIHDLGRIEASIRRFGWRGAVTVAPGPEAGTWRLLAGHGRVGVLRRLRDAHEAPPRGCEGWEVPAMVETGLAGAEAAAFVVAENEAGARSRWEPLGLAELLADVEAQTGSLAGTGYTSAAVAQIVDRVEAGLRAVVEAEPEPAAEPARAITLLFPAREFPEIVAAFARVMADTGLTGYADTVRYLLEDHGRKTEKA